MFGFLITSVPIRGRTSISTASKRLILVLYEGIHRFSRAIISGYPYVLKAYPIRVPIGPQGLSYGGTHRAVTIPIPLGIGGIGIGIVLMLLVLTLHLKNRSTKF